MTQESYSHHVFLSYSRKDAEAMRHVRKALRAEGLTVWTDETGLEPGTPDWEIAIAEAIKTSQCMVVLLSPDAALSKWVAIETAFAEKRGRRIIPLLVRGDPLEAVPFRLTNTHYIDARSDLNSATQKLIEAVCKHLGVESLSAQREREAEEEVPAEEEDEELPDWLVAEAPEEETPKPVPILDILPPPFEWCEIPAVADFRLMTDEGDKGTFTINPFYMAKYPITFEQFQVFVDDPQGFGNPEWWHGLAADADHRQAPGMRCFTHAKNLPRENVSWYDAVAFCRWLIARCPRDLLPFSLREKGPGDEGQVVRLPTEWEWQWAAQGSDGRHYPWGPYFDKTRCNTEKSGIWETTPVDQYPSGASLFGVMDMAGNVWEWCLNEYDNPTNIGLGGDAGRVVRGGSWYNLRGSARCTCRVRDYPSFRSRYRGFRVVVAPPISHK